jgi:hypothetical protein
VSESLGSMKSGEFIGKFNLSTVLQPFVGSWPLLQFFDPVHSR